MIQTIHPSSESKGQPLQQKQKQTFQVSRCSCNHQLLSSLKSSNILSLLQRRDRKKRHPLYLKKKTETYIYACNVFPPKKQRIIISLWVWQVLTRCLNFLFRKGDVENQNCLFQSPKPIIEESDLFCSEQKRPTSSAEGCIQILLYKSAI